MRPMAAAFDAGHAREDHVAVQRLVHLLGAEEEIGLSLTARSSTTAILGTQEPEAVGVPDDLALDEARLVGDEDRAAAVAHHLPVALHRMEAPLEPLEGLRALDAEAPGELFLGNRDPLRRERLEDRLAARYLDRIRLQALGFDGPSPVHAVNV